jgi:hypothetical protein
VMKTIKLIVTGEMENKALATHVKKKENNG